MARRDAVPVDNFGVLVVTPNSSSGVMRWPLSAMLARIDGDHSTVVVQCSGHGWVFLLALDDDAYRENLTLCTPIVSRSPADGADPGPIPSRANPPAGNRRVVSAAFPDFVSRRPDHVAIGCTAQSEATHGAREPAVVAFFMVRFDTHVP